MMALLRRHGPADGPPAYRLKNGGMSAPCMHAGGGLVNSQTTASWVSELRPDAPPRHFATGTSCPCLASFKPVAVETPVDTGPAPGEGHDASLWWRAEVLHRRALGDWPGRAPRFQAVAAPLEAAGLDGRLDSAAAFRAAAACLPWLDAQLADLAADRPGDHRPGRVRRYWSRRDEVAGLDRPVSGAAPEAAPLGEPERALLRELGVPVPA